MREDANPGCLGIRGFTLFLFGLLLLLLVILIGLPAGLGLGLGWRPGPAEARRYELPRVTDARSSMIAIDAKRYIAKDLDEDGVVECLFEARPFKGEHAYYRKGYSRQCYPGSLGWLNLRFGAGELVPQLGDQASATHRFKTQHSLSTVSVMDLNDDEAVDCVVDMGRHGLVYRADEAACPFLEWSIPDALPDSDLKEVLQRLLELEDQVRRTLAGEE